MTEGIHSKVADMAKIHLVASDDQISQSRIISLEECYGFDEFYLRVKEKFALFNIKLKYKDQDGDMITMSDDYDFDLATNSSSALSSNFRLVVWAYEQQT